VNMQIIAMFIPTNELPHGKESTARQAITPSHHKGCLVLIHFLYLGNYCGNI